MIDAVVDPAPKMPLIWFNLLFTVKRLSPVTRITAWMSCKKAGSQSGTKVPPVVVPLSFRFTASAFCPVWKFLSLLRLASSMPNY